MLLGIPYHVAMSYRAGQEWIITSSEGAPFFNHLAQTIHVFRMPAFFILAGYFAALLLARRSPGEWLGGRLTRIGIPFLAAILTLNPLLNLLCELSNYGWADALVSWDRNSATSGGYWIRHLWFLIVLLYLSAVAALFFWLFPRLRQSWLPLRTDDWLARHPFGVIVAAGLVMGLWQAFAIELFYVWGFATNLPQQILRLDQLVEAAPWFLIGCVIARAPNFREALYRFSPAIALFAIIALGLDLAFRESLWAPYGRFLDTLAGIAMTQLLIATLRRIADRPSRPVQEMVEASFVIYLFHLPIVATLVVIGQHVSMPLALKAPLVMALTLALSYGIWRIVQGSPLLRLLYDGVRPPRPAPSRPPLATRHLGRQGL